MERADANYEGACVPGPHCTQCNYKSRCPIIHNYEVPALSPETPLPIVVEAARQVFAVKAALKQAEGGIKSFLLDTGREELDLGNGCKYYLSHSTKLLAGKPHKGKKEEEE
jgi:hypothetical protein